LFRVVPVAEAEAELAVALYARVDTLDAFDALLAAAALGAGVDAVMSADRAFDMVDDLERIDPLDSDAVAALGFNA
jgi:predicted nucleic acid-binding protein